MINAEITGFSRGIHAGLMREKRVLTSEYPMITRELRGEHAGISPFLTSGGCIEIRNT